MLIDLLKTAWRDSAGENEMNSAGQGQLRTTHRPPSKSPKCLRNVARVRRLNRVDGSLKSFGRDSGSNHICRQMLALPAVHG